MLRASLTPAAIAGASLMTADRLRWASVLMVSLFSALFFHEPWSWPLTDTFPRVERLLDPGFLPNDFYTNSIDSYSAREYFARCLAIASQWTGFHYTEVASGLNLVRLVLTGIVFYLFCNAVAGNRNAAFMAFLLGAGSLYMFPLTPGYFFVGNNLTGHGVTVLCNLAGAYALLRGAYFTAWVLLAVSALLHPVNGLHGLLLVALVALCSRERWKILAHWRSPRVIAGGLLFTTAIMANYLPYRAAMPESGLSITEFRAILVDYNLPFHYSPTRLNYLPRMQIWAPGFPVWTGWIVFAGFLATYFYMLHRRWNELRERGMFVGLAGLLGLLAAAGWLFTDVLPVKEVITAMPFRAMTMFVPFYLCLYGLHVCRLWQEGRARAAVLLALPFIPVFSHNAIRHWFLVTWYDWLVTVAFFACFLLAVISTRHPVRETREPAQPWLRPSWKLATGLCAALAVYGSVRHENEIPSLDSAPGIYSVLNTQTAPDSIILAEFTAASNQWIRLIARRAVAISCDFSFLEKDFQAWEQRFRDLYGTPYREHGFVDRLSAEALNRVADRYGITHVVRNRPLEDPAGHFSPGIVVEWGGRYWQDVYLYQNLAQ